MDPYLKQERRKSSASVLSWLLAIVPSLIGLMLWLSLQRAVDAALAVSGVSTWSWDAIKTFAFIGFGLIWMAGVFILQHMLYRSAVRGWLWSRFMQVTAFLLVMLACSHAIRFPLGAESASPGTLLPIVLETALAAALYYINRQIKARRTA